MGRGFVIIITTFCSLVDLAMAADGRALGKVSLEEGEVEMHPSFDDSLLYELNNKVDNLVIEPPLPKSKTFGGGEPK